MRLARFALGTFAFVLLMAAPASALTRRGPVRHAAAAGTIGLRLLDVPVAERNDPRAQVYVVDHVAAGSVVQRRIEVFNTSPSNLPVLLYPAAATIAAGEFLGAAGHQGNSVSSWTSVSPGESDVAANGHATATITIAVPRDAAPGEQYGVVWAEVRSTPRGGIGVTQVNRVGIRLYISVGPGGAPASNFAIESLTAERARDGRPSVLAAVHNTGGRALDMSGTLKLSHGPGQLSAGPFPVTLGVTLGIGETEHVTITLDRRLPAGPWDARITLRSGLIERTARATITFPDTGAAAPVTTSSGAHRWPSVPTDAVVVLFAAVLATVVALPLRRRNARPA